MLHFFILFKNRTRRNASFNFVHCIDIIFLKYVLCLSVRLSFLKKPDFLRAKRAIFEGSWNRKSFQFFFFARWRVFQFRASEARILDSPAGPILQHSERLRKCTKRAETLRLLMPSFSGPLTFCTHKPTIFCTRFILSVVTIKLFISKSLDLTSFKFSRYFYWAK